MVGILDYLKKNIIIDESLLDNLKAEDYDKFNKKAKDKFYPLDRKTRYVVVPEEELQEQGKLLLGYIRNKDAGGIRQGYINPEMLLDAAFKIKTTNGLNGFQFAQLFGDNEITAKLIKTAKPEQLFLQDRYGSTALHNAVIAHNEEDALAIISKEGITSKQLFLQDEYGSTALHSAVKAHNKKEALAIISKEGVTAEQLLLKDNDKKTVLDYLVGEEKMKPVIVAIGRIVGIEELSKHYKDPIFSDVIEQLDLEKNILYGSDQYITPKMIAEKSKNPYYSPPK